MDDLFAAELQNGDKRRHDLAAAAAAAEQQLEARHAELLEPVQNFLRLALDGIRLAAHDLAQRRARWRGQLFPALHDRLHSKHEVSLFVAVLVNFAALHGLGLARHDAAAKLAHRAERFGQRLDAKVRVLLLALFERGNELVHLALRLLILKRKQHARFDVH